MIISASRRTDVPAFYFKWFLQRLREGYALIPNPRNPNRIGRVDLCPDKVDCIVFWSKNPLPMMDKLDEFDQMGYPYYVQFTLTPYEQAIERALPPKEKLVEAFIDLARRTGPKGVVWRYDPIFVDKNQSIPWHTQQFTGLCQKLAGHTQRCVISFIDSYKSISEAFRPLTQAEILELAATFSAIAKTHGIALFTCAEDVDLSAYHINHSACIDQRLVEAAAGYPIIAKKDGNQRPACCCVESVDIGAYDTCSNGCTYCYATSSQKALRRSMAAHDPMAPMLTGYPRGDEIITNRTTPSQKTHQQLSLF